MRPRTYWTILLALLAVHAATLIALMAWLPWTTDEPFYLQTGVTLRETGEWRMFHSILHGPLPFYANQLFAWAAPVEPWLEFKFWGRLGMLPFALIAASCVAGLARAAFGPRAALFAVALHCANPVVLANAPLMTTDMALAAGYAATAWAAFNFLRAPSWPRVLILGVVLGLALATKYTALFLPLSLS